MEEETFDKPLTDQETIDSDSVTINVESIDGADSADGESVIIGSVDEESGIKINVPGVYVNFNLSKLLQAIGSVIAAARVTGATADGNGGNGGNATDGNNTGSSATGDRGGDAEGSDGGNAKVRN
ncbi:hypothetical protein LIT25_15920 [Bacillus sp. F19]|nr:hypothetical protein LIT25_15920 [Bacillus sp. F19]